MVCDLALAYAAASVPFLGCAGFAYRHGDLKMAQRPRGYYANGTFGLLPLGAFVAFFLTLPPDFFVLCFLFGFSSMGSHVTSELFC